ncbi:MAG: hypothetical protein AAFO94_16470 [Bacteroidota bacterium]
MRSRFLLLTLLLFLGACQPNDTRPELLRGQWQGIAFTESADSVKLDPSEITFDFRPNGVYHYTSTLNYKEAGSYKLDGAILYTTDTVWRVTGEKAVEIAFEGKDTLLVNMNRDGIDQQLLMRRQ